MYVYWNASALAWWHYFVICLILNHKINVFFVYNVFSATIPFYCILLVKTKYNLFIFTFCFIHSIIVNWWEQQIINNYYYSMTLIVPSTYKYGHSLAFDRICFVWESIYRLRPILSHRTIDYSISAVWRWNMKNSPIIKNLITFIKTYKKVEYEVLYYYFFCNKLVLTLHAQLHVYMQCVYKLTKHGQGSGLLQQVLNWFTYVL